MIQPKQINKVYDYTLNTQIRVLENLNVPVKFEASTRGYQVIVSSVSFRILIQSENSSDNRILVMNNGDLQIEVEIDQINSLASSNIYIPTNPIQIPGYCAIEITVYANGIFAVVTPSQIVKKKR